MKIRNLLVPAALLTALVGTALAGSANASTSGCASSVYGTACGAVTDVESPTALSLDAFHQGAAYNQPIIGYFNATGDKASDLLTLPQAHGVIFEYAPNGVASGLCLSEPFGSAAIVERPCNTLGWQTFAKVAVYQVFKGTASDGYVAKATDLPAGDSFSATESTVTPPTTEAGFVLVNSKTGDVVTFKGLRHSVVGTPNPASAPIGVYSASQVFAG